MIPSLQSAHCQLWGCCMTALCGYRAALLLMQTSMLLCTAGLGGHRGPFHHIMDVSGVKICQGSQANLSAMKRTLAWETFKLREYQMDQPQGYPMIQTEQLDPQKAFKQEEADDGIAMQNSKCSTNNDIGIHWRRLKIQLKHAFHLAPDCSIMPTQTKARCKSILRSTRSSTLKTKISC